MFQGQYFQLVPRDQFAELIFDSQTDGVNTLNRAALEELEQAIAIISATDITGLIIRSGKALFSAGADVKAFRALFDEGDETVDEYLSWVHGIYNSLEALPIPKVALLNGVAAGGGVELSLLAE
ncbi:enoyl-CoA hydratase-related protein, partial [Shewanella sp.]|uniref:enoyl-CoA hydratase-related protein n=1 Tax=Shewanella sp. TaxID=50422 RepID=UPI002584D62A